MNWKCNDSLLLMMDLVDEEVDRCFGHTVGDIWDRALSLEANTAELGGNDDKSWGLRCEK
jgi:hypothetical protein